MTALCASPIKAQVARFTRVNFCGVPVTGAGSAQITTDSFTQIENSPQYEEGERYLLKKANGQPCVNQRDPGFFNWLEQTTTVCSIDPDLLVTVTGEDLVLNGATGTGVSFGEGLLESRFSMEVWQPVAGAGACDASGVQRFVYWAFPNAGDAQIQDFTFENGAFTFGFKSITRQASPLWGLGATWLVGTGVWGPGKHYAFNVTTVAPPDAGVCGAVLI